MDSVIWYTKTDFLFKCLNEALRSDNIDAIFIFQSFISEFSSELSKLHRDFCRRLLFTDVRRPVYRGVKMKIQEIQQFQSNIGDLICANQYLSTTYDRAAAEMFGGFATAACHGEVSALFEIRIDRCIDNKDAMCAAISRWSVMPDEEEVVFNLGCVFRVIKVTCPVADENFWHIILESSKATMNETSYYQYLKQRADELDQMRPDIALGRLFVDLGAWNQVHTYLNECLMISTYKNSRADDDAKHAYIYDTLGRLYFFKKQPYEAIAYFTWAFNRFRARHQSVEANEALRFLAKLISELLDPQQLLNICKQGFVPLEIYADAYFRLGMVNKARKTYLELIQTLYASNPIDHIRLAENLTRLGEIYRMHSIFSRAYDHLRTVLPEQHPFILKVVDHMNSTKDTADDALPWIEISIVHQQGRAIRKFVVERSDTINDIKALLQRHFGLFCNTQTLQDESERLLTDNSATMADYTLQSGAILRLTVDPEPDPRRIFVQNAMDVIEIADVHWWQSIYDIKRYLCDRSKLPPPKQQRLFEAGRELSDDFFCGKLKCSTTRLLLALREHGLKDEPEKSVNFYVQLPLPARGPQWKKPAKDDKRGRNPSIFMQDVYDVNQYSIRYLEDPCEITVERLKVTISENCGIPIQFQRLTLNTTELTVDIMTLASYGVTRSSIIELDIVNVPLQVTFLVQNAHVTHRITIDSNETIEGLKKHISKNMRVPSEQINLDVSGHALSPEHHSILKVFQTNRHIKHLYEMNVRVTVPENAPERYCYGVARLVTSDQNKTIKLHLNSECISFEKLRTLIFTATGIPISDQRLYADEQLLCSGQKLDSNSIKRLFVFRKQPADFTVKISVSGHTLLRLRLPSATTTQDLKRIVKYLRGVPVRKQRLFIGLTELSDLNEIIQKRTSGRRIDIVRADEKKVTFVRYKKRWILFKVDPWENMAAFKARIQSELSVCLDQYILLHDGIVLRLDVCPFWFISDKSELHLVRSRVHLDYIYVMEHGAKAIAACEWSSMTTIDDICQAIARLHRIKIVQPYHISDKLGPNSTVCLVRLISLRIIDPEKRRVMNLSIESRRTIFELKQELQLPDASVRREFLYQNEYLSDEEIVEEYDNATLLIQSIASETPDNDRFDPLYIKRNDYYNDILECTLRDDGTDTDQVKEYHAWLKERAEIIRQAKYGDEIDSKP